MEAILPITLLLLAFYLLVLRPTQARNRRAADLRDHLTPGVQIITTAGVFGRVESVSEDEVALEIAPGVVVKLLKGAVGRIIPADEADTDAAPEQSAASDPDEGPTSLTKF
ncbi:MAG: preprotein translocase subunit YajC [Sporichthyaceae bacterium]